MPKIKQEIKVIEELREYLVPLTEEEYLVLEQSILSEGCRDHLVVWQRSDNESVLVDGHNRFEICKKNNIDFSVTNLKFTDIEHVKAWMIDNQIGRRNLNSEQLSYYRGLKYLSLKKIKGGYDNIKSKGQSGPLTSDLLSEQFKVSASTIKRDAKFAEGLNIIGKSNPSLKMQILLGDVKVKKSDVQILPEANEASQLKIRNEADLFNKAKIIKDEILDEVENSINKIENDRVERAKKELLDREPLFLDRENRIVKIKGMILSAINRAINERNIDIMQELKKLIERLEYELLS